MKRFVFGCSIGLIMGGTSISSHAQGVHFSQFTNVPTLFNPANTGLVNDADYRLSAITRTQWTNIPVNYNTNAVTAEFKMYPNEYTNNWLAVGGNYIKDVAGDGKLSLNKININIAYHLKFDDYHMISAGVGGLYSERKIDFNNFSYDMQWNGLVFDRNQYNGEVYNYQKTNYFDVTAGINYAYIPSDLLYINVGVGLMNVLGPKESFYKADNRLGLRPVVALDILAKTSENLIINPAAYFSKQKGATEGLLGSNILYNMSPGQPNNTILKLGLFYRLADALVVNMGVEWKNISVVGSTDISVGGVAKLNNSLGGFELSVLYKGLYSSSRFRKDRSTYGCPRF